MVESGYCYTDTPSMYVCIAVPSISHSDPISCWKKRGQQGLGCFWAYCSPGVCARRVDVSRVCTLQTIEPPSDPPQNCCSSTRITNHTQRLAEHTRHAAALAAEERAAGATLTSHDLHVLGAPQRCGATTVQKGTLEGTTLVPDSTHPPPRPARLDGERIRGTAAGQSFGMTLSLRPPPDVCPPRVSA